MDLADIYPDLAEINLDTYDDVWFSYKYPRIELDDLRERIASRRQMLLQLPNAVTALDEITCRLITYGAQLLKRGSENRAEALECFSEARRYAYDGRTVPDQYGYQQLGQHRDRFRVLEIIGGYNKTVTLSHRSLIHVVRSLKETRQSLRELTPNPMSGGLQEGITDVLDAILDEL